MPQLLILFIPGIENNYSEYPKFLESLYKYGTVWRETLALADLANDHKFQPKYSV